MVLRDELYRLVWSEPTVWIAARFDVSSSYLARICTRLNVPRPERGYWAKLAVGKATPQPPLPEPLPGDPLEWTRDGEAQRVSPPKPALPRQQCATEVRIARNSVHGLVLGARELFEHGRPIDEGTYLKPYKKLMLDVTTSQACLEKALDLANDLYNAFHSVGHRVVIAPANSNTRRATIEEREVATKPRNHWEYSQLWSPYRPTLVYVGTVAIGLAIIEMSENVTLRYVRGNYIRESDYVPPRRGQNDHTWTTTRDVPSGRVRIVAYSPYGRGDWSKEWQETKTVGLRSQIRSIVKETEAFAPELVERLEEADHQAEIRHQKWLRQQDKRKREEDQRQILQSIDESKTDLQGVIERWDAVVSVERFLAGVEARAVSLPDGERAAVIERLALARSFLGTQDPLEFFRGWKTPVERYAPRYPEHADARIVTRMG